MGFPPQGIAIPAVADTRTSTIVVAASNSLDPNLAPAAYRCDGVADDVELNAALIAAAAVNGRVELLEGAYNTVLTLSVAVNVALVGNGSGSVINFNAGGNAITIAGDNVKLRDFKVVIVAGAGGAGTRPNGIMANTQTKIEIFGVWVIGDRTVADDGSNLRQNGVYIYLAPESRILNNRVEENNRQNIFLHTTDDCAVTGNTCYNGYRGVYLYLSNNNTIVGNTCQGNTIDGIRLFTGSENNTIVGNTSQGNGNNGISLGTANNNTIVGNTFQGNGFDGIILSTADNNTVVGNTCQGNTYDGIRLFTDSDNNTVVGNTCQGNTIDGIGIEDGSDSNLVMGNTCKLNGEWGIMVDTNSDYNKISNNYTNGNTSGSIRVNNANCNNTQIEFNTVEEGAPSDVGTATRSYGNYDPSADAFVGNVGAAPF